MAFSLVALVIGALALAGLVYLMVHPRTRWFGVALVIFGAAGLLVLRLRHDQQIQHDAAVAVQPDRDWQTAMASQQQSMRDAMAAQQDSLRASMEAQRDALQEATEAQRLAMQQGAEHQWEGSDGWRADTYTHSYRQESNFKAWIVFAPLAAIVLALVAMRRRGAHAGRMGWIVAGMILLLAFGAMFYGTRRVEYSGPWTPTPPVASVAPRVQTSVGFERREAERTEPEKSSAGAEGEKPMDELWERLTGPQIALNENAAAPTDSSDAAASKGKKDVIAAAKLILSANVPGADPFTQSWLKNAAKNLLEEEGKSSEDGSNPAAIATQTATSPAAIMESAAAAMPADAAHAMAEAQFGEAADPAGAIVAAEVPMEVEVTSDEAPADEQPPAVWPQFTSLESKGRPDWVESAPSLVGNVRRFALSSGPYVTIGECHRDLEQQMRDVVQTRIREKVEEAVGPYNTHVPDLSSMGIGTDFILREFCKEEYVETVDRSVGEMKQVHIRMDFDAAQDEMLLDRWKSYARGWRLAITGALSGLILGGVALVYGLLKVDTWTRGYYTKRLFLGVPGAIIALILLGAALNP